MLRFLKKEAVELMGTIAVGCGGAGCNAVNRLGKLSDADIMTVNTDKKGLVRSRSNLRVLLGDGSNEEGCGGNVELGTKLTEESSDRIKEGVAGYRDVYVIAGLGGGTGTASANIVARTAKRSGSRVISILSMPMAFEAGRREKAMKALPEIIENSDTTVILDADRLAEIDPMIGAREAFSVLDQMICELFIAISEMFSSDAGDSLLKMMKGLVTVSFAEGMNTAAVADRLIRGTMVRASARSPPLVFVRGNIPDATIQNEILRSTGMQPVFIQGPAGQGMNLIMFSPIVDPFSV
ncbi:MAG: hypothetical protein FWF40_02100 [Methanomassiliicoccaceae archaeon]|nr:hypothetical protein [Methanomassiliicoccaceae archaeon]